VARKEWKFTLTRSLYDRGYERQDILNLFRFIDWILELPQDLKRSFRDDLEAYERENQMPYVTSIERMAEAKGEAKGEERQKQTIALNLLRKNISLETIAEVTGLTIEQLQQLQSIQSND
jgi:predicted transposase/invertase (TIGR01784 family)